MVPIILYVTPTLIWNSLPVELLLVSSGVRLCGAEFGFIAIEVVREGLVLGSGAATPAASAHG